MESQELENLGLCLKNIQELILKLRINGFVDIKDKKL
jgi:hypothetical protein